VPLKSVSADLTTTISLNCYYHYLSLRSDFAYCDRGLSVSLSPSCILLKRQKTSTGFFFAYDRPMSLADRVNIRLISVTHSSLNCAPTWPDPPPVDLSVGDIPLRLM